MVFEFNKMTSHLGHHSLAVVTVRLLFSDNTYVRDSACKLTKQLQPSVEKSLETCAGLFIWDISEIACVIAQPA